VSEVAKSGDTMIENIVVMMEKYNLFNKVLLKRKNKSFSFKIKYWKYITYKM
jgi:hypothetical protein